MSHIKLKTTRLRLDEGLVYEKDESNVESPSHGSVVKKLAFSPNKSRLKAQQSEDTVIKKIAEFDSSAKRWPTFDAFVNKAPIGSTLFVQNTHTNTHHHQTSRHFHRHADSFKLSSQKKIHYARRLEDTRI